MNEIFISLLIVIGIIAMTLGGAAVYILADSSRIVDPQDKEPPWFQEHSR